MTKYIQRGRNPTYVLKLTIPKVDTMMPVLPDVNSFSRMLVIATSWRADVAQQYRVRKK